MRNSIMKNKILLIVYSIFLMGLHANAQRCIDEKATLQTQNLFKNLYALQGKKIMFGHQDALAYGVGWKYEEGRSDIQSLVKDNPAIYGWDVGLIEWDSSRNLDGVPFTKMKQYIRQAYDAGAVVTISWHLRNPYTGNNAWDTTHGSMASVLPGAAKHELYKTWLNRLAAFLNDLKDEKGTRIPILFRPYHELTGNWFWWCQNNGSADEFKTLWKFTVDYLKNEKQLHHLLYVYNTAEFNNEAHFLERYPGDDYVDVLSMDKYQFAEKPMRQPFIQFMRRQLDIITRLAAQKKKIAALAETGLEAIPDKHWWTKTLWPILQGYALSYVLVWRNEGYMLSLKKMHYYAPYPGQASAKDFKKFYKNKTMLFQKKMRALNIYQ